MTQINNLIYNAINTLQSNIVLNNVTTIGTSIMQAGLSVVGTLAITGNLTVSGSVSMPGYMWAAGFVSSTGTKITSTGQTSWSVSRSSLGLYTITWGTAHPSGASYIVTVTGQGSLAMVRNVSPPTSTSFQVALYSNATTVVIDNNFSFMVLASYNICIILTYINNECKYNKN